LPGGDGSARAHDCLEHGPGGDPCKVAANAYASTEPYEKRIWEDHNIELNSYALEVGDASCFFISCSEGHCCSSFAMTDLSIFRHPGSSIRRCCCAARLTRLSHKG